MKTVCQNKQIFSIIVIVIVATLLVSCKSSSDNSKDEVVIAEHLRGLPVIISEVHSANADYKDEFGKDPGWVEFYNPADTAVDLNGYYLTNGTSDDSERWRFGNVVIPPREYLTVFMSKRDIPDHIPPSDSVDILKAATGVKTSPEFSLRGVIGVLRGNRNSASAKFSKGRSKLSGTFKVRNTQASYASTTLSFNDKNGLNITPDVDQILLNGFINKGDNIKVVFLYPGVDDNEAWSATIKGTGVENDRYVIELPSAKDGGPDRANISGLSFVHDPRFRGTLAFDFNSITVRKRGSNVHASFTLRNKKGGKLFLTDGESNIIDSAQYPEGTRGLSYARIFETGAWAHSRPPTPNGANSAETYINGKAPMLADTSLPKSGHYAEALSFTIPQGDDGAVVVCDVTGKLPVKDGELRSGVAVNFSKTTMMRCAQFKDGAHPSDPVMRTYVVGRLPDLPIVSIAVDPHDMFDDKRGLHAKGPNAERDDPQYGANFWKDTELPVQIEFFENGMKPGWSHLAGLRIFGNWSRMNAKKSVVISFRDRYEMGRLQYPLFPDNPELKRFKHFLLRCNGDNFGLDYMRDMLMSSLTEGLDIDYQRGRSVIVYYNGEYYGIYGLRERSNADYFDTKYGVDQDNVDLVKMSGEVGAGSDADYRSMISWLEGLDGLSDSDLAALEQRADIDNYTNQFICRIYYHDRDWPGNNMKWWRTRSPQSRWKWFMYDTDWGWGGSGLKFEPEINTMNFVTATDCPNWPNPPHSTFLFRKLLDNENYRNSFINRFSLIMATYFAPERVNARIDALMAPIESEIPFDQERWGHDVAFMNAQMDTIRTFNDWRRPQMQAEIEEFFKLGNGVEFTVAVDGNDKGMDIDKVNDNGKGKDKDKGNKGKNKNKNKNKDKDKDKNVDVDEDKSKNKVEGKNKILVHNLEVMNGTATFKAYPAAPIVLKAVPAEGSVFERWSDGVTDAERVVTVAGGEPITLRAIFK